MRTAAWLALALGVVLRLAACYAHEAPRGDVVLDVGVARSLASGQGFASGFDRALARVAGPPAPVPRQDLADQHAPLWPLLGAVVSSLAGGPFDGLQLSSLLCGLLLLALVWRAADRLTEGLSGAPDGLAPLAAGLTAVCFVLVDASGNGSLYVAQAALVLVLVELLAAARPSLLGAGLCLGALLLLNHQCAVLLPLPAFVLAAGAAPGRRLAASARGLGVIAVALACLMPWWVRNALAFGDPFHSVNGIYFLSKAGVSYSLGLEQGQAVLRFAHDLDPLLMVRASAGFLLPNLLYVLTAGLFVWPALLGVVAVGLPGLAVTALAGRDRRLLGLLAATLLLGAVAVAWPATKLRYLVSLAPFVVLIGVRLLAARPARSERRFALVVLVAWVGLLVATRDDVLGGGVDPRPARWWILLVAGLGLLVLPALVRAWGAGVHRVLLSGLPVSAALSLAVLFGPGPGTAYHSAPFLADVFGQPAEVVRERDVVAAAWSRDVLARQAARSVAGPIELLAWDGPPLVELPPAGPLGLQLTLSTLLSRGAVDHVVLTGDMLDWLAETEPGIRQRLVLVEQRDPDAAGVGAAVYRVEG